MADALLPLFPLGLVLFPGAPLPLHIFEDRYKEMIGEAVEQNSEFGIVLAVERGIVSAGCTARVTHVDQRYDDGRLDILTHGYHRFEVEALDQERSFLRAQVRYFDDDDPEAPEELRRQAAAAFSQAFRTAFPEPVDPELPQLSFHLAQAVTDLSARQTLLQMRSEADRLRQLLELLPALGERQSIEERMRALAPRNGHGKHLK